MNRLQKFVDSPLQEAIWLLLILVGFLIGNCGCAPERHYASIPCTSDHACFKVWDARYTGHHDYILYNCATEHYFNLDAPPMGLSGDGLLNLANQRAEEELRKCGIDPEKTTVLLQEGKP